MNIMLHTWHWEIGDRYLIKVEIEGRRHKFLAQWLVVFTWFLGQAKSPSAAEVKEKDKLSFPRRGTEQ